MDTKTYIEALNRGNMLPFLKNRDKSAGISGTIVKQRQPDEPQESDESDITQLIDAIHNRDAESAESALKSIFKSFDKEPHEEGEHIQPHSYDASKE